MTNRGMFRSVSCFSTRKCLASFTGVRDKIRRVLDTPRSSVGSAAQWPPRLTGIASSGYRPHDGPMAYSQPRHQQTYDLSFPNNRPHQSTQLFGHIHDGARGHASARRSSLALATGLAGDAAYPYPMTDASSIRDSTLHSWQEHASDGADPG